MFLLFRRIMDMADPHASNRWTALITTAAFGLHPASAETVNLYYSAGRSIQYLGLCGEPLAVHAVPHPA
jgi:hypothetical protein